MKFYNTIRAPRDKEHRYRRRAATQAERILAIFRMYPHGLFSPERICRGYQYHYKKDLNINSCRRAITDLTTAGHLIKTDVMVPGDCGKPVHQWKLNPDE